MATNYKNKKKLHETTFTVPVLAVNIYYTDSSNKSEKKTSMEDNVFLDIVVPNKYKDNKTEMFNFIESETYRILSGKFKGLVHSCQIYLQDDNSKYSIHYDDSAKYKSSDEIFDEYDKQEDND